MTYGQLKSLEAYARQAAKAFDLRDAKGRAKAWREWSQEAVRGGAGAAHGFCRAPRGWTADVETSGRPAGIAGTLEALKT
eukprot:3079667-Pyramimonas_sp.AAC.1